MKHTELHITSDVGYGYYLAEKLLEREEVAKHISSLNTSKAIFLVDENVWNAHEGYIKNNLISSFQSHFLKLIPSGEPSKSLQLFSSLIEDILCASVDRSTPLFAIGGGVCGDLSGFIASSLLRGLPLYHIPTTSLSMVDSSIGGKTGINSQHGKNLIGAFYQPKAIWADTYFLSTLDFRQMLCGLSETIKHGWIARPELIDLCEEWVKGNSKSVLSQLIYESARVKMEIVQKDTLEKGIRAHLNLGHTFGHAIEAAAGYGNILHGEAVFIGMIAADYAASVLYSRSTETFIDHFLPLYSAYITADLPDPDSLIPYMYKDKKMKEGQIHLVLCPELGRAEVVGVNDERLLIDSFEYAYSKLNSAD